MTTSFSSIPLSAIANGDRLRTVDAAWVEVIAGSMEQTGLRQPIVVRPHPLAPGAYLLVAGAHRLAAATALGWEEITADVQQLDDRQARLVEIDENLTRRELTALDRAVFMSERKKIYEELHPEAVHGGDRKSKAQRLQDNIKSPDVATCSMFPRFTAATASATGFSERVVQRLCGLVSQLDPQAIELLRGTEIAANQSALLQIAGLPADDQIALARLLANGDADTLAKAKEKAGLTHETVRDEQARFWAQFLTIWSKASTQTRAAIRDHVASGAKRAA
jgi:ParB family chromosome partitioning protein